MKKIRFMLEYHSNPIWIENEKGELLSNGLPIELENRNDFADLLENIAEEYDNLFENNNINFEYHGFENEAQKKSFFDKVAFVIDFLKRELSNKYVIQIDVDPRLKMGERLSPIEVYKIPGKGYFIQDGHHRFVASQITGIPIEINVLPGIGPIGLPDWIDVLP